MAQLGDGTTNPFTTSYGGYLFVFNGTTWDRVRSSEGANSQTIGALAAGMMLRNASNQNEFARPASAKGDAETGAGMPATSPWAWNGASWDRSRTPKIFKPQSATAIGSEATIWTPAAGKKFRLMGMCVSVGTAAGNVTLKDNTAGTTIFVVPKGPIDTVFFMEFGNGIVSAAANNVLTATGVATATLSGTIWGTEE